MARSSSTTHAFIQYIQDKEKEIVSITQITTSKTANIACGKTVSVQWYNEETAKWDIYEAYVHFLGNSETDVEAQVQKAEENGTRLKLPSQKVIDSILSQEEVKFSNDEVKAKKARIDLAKSKLRDEILQKKKADLVMSRREPLHLDFDDESDKENHLEVQNKEDEHGEPTISEIPSTAGENQQTPAQSAAAQSDEAKNDLERRSGTDGVKLKRYDKVNDKTYLGAGLFVDTSDWISISAIKDHGPFIIQLAYAIWGDDLQNMCLDESKAKPRYEGQIRKQFRKKQIKALEEIFMEKLRFHGYKGNRKLKKMLKRVRTTLTHKINDLNKKKGNAIQEGESSDSEY